MNLDAEKPPRFHDHSTLGPARPPAAAAWAPRGGAAEVILSFDVEEHYRIEAAAGLDVAPGLKADYAGRVTPTTEWLLERLGARDILATFFIVGQFARDNPALVRSVHRAGHEVASHG